MTEVDDWNPESLLGSATRGDAEAQRRLGWLLGNIGGDLVAAEGWLRRSAEQGNEIAIGNLAGLLLVRSRLGQDAGVMEEGAMWAFLGMAHGTVDRALALPILKREVPRAVLRRAMNRALAKIRTGGSS